LTKIPQIGSVKQYLFSYGTLQNDQVQLNLFGKCLAGSPDRLTGYKIVSIEITDKEFLSKGEQKIQRTLVFSNNSRDTIEGMALEISPGELLMADQYEPENYKRISVMLESGKQAWIYAAVQT